MRVRNRPKAALRANPEIYGAVLRKVMARG
jgi:hypothetical protein